MNHMDLITIIHPDFFIFYIPKSIFRYVAIDVIMVTGFFSLYSIKFSRFSNSMLPPPLLLLLAWISFKYKTKLKNLVSFYFFFFLFQTSCYISFFSVAENFFSHICICCCCCCYCMISLLHTFELHTFHHHISEWWWWWWLYNVKFWM